MTYVVINDPLKCRSNLSYCRSVLIKIEIEAIRSKSFRSLSLGFSQSHRHISRQFVDGHDHNSRDSWIALCKTLIKIDWLRKRKRKSKIMQLKATAARKQHTFLSHTMPKRLCGNQSISKSLIRKSAESELYISKQQSIEEMENLRAKHQEKKNSQQIAMRMEK